MVNSSNKIPFDFTYKMYSVESSYRKVTLLHKVTRKDQRA